MDLEETLTRYQKVKKHVNKYKRFYIVGGVGCAIGLTWYVRGRVLVPVTVTGDQNVTAGKKVVMHHVNYITSGRQGPPSWVVRCKETGDVFTSQRSAALAMDLPQNVLSEHLNGLRSDVVGNHFERLCLSV